MQELIHKVLTYDQRFYLLESPKDYNLSAQQAYRSFITRDFDLVLIENGYPLEPNYVIIEGLPIDCDKIEIKRLNLESAGIEFERATV